METEFPTAKRFMGQMMALNSPTEDATRRIGVFLERARPEGGASGSGFLPARLALFEERGVALAGGR